MSSRFFSSWRSLYRSHTCGELTTVHNSLPVTLSGWIDAIRPRGPLITFLTLRDRTGTTQIVMHHENNEVANILKECKPESVITITGKVRTFNSV